MKKVIILPPEVSRKIAAGEVIDRPCAIVRELLDNAIDSGATSITCHVDGGGIDRICVVDNGTGMSKEDLELCCEPHATSKISTEADLLTLNTLGFRGEALASIAAVSRLTIMTHDSNSDSSWVLESSIIEKSIKSGNLAEGTIVESCGVFENFPARRQFLKRPSSELAMCKQTFIEKTLPRNDINFRLICDDKIKYDFKASDSKIKRVIDALEISENEELFYELKGNDQDNWNYSLIIGEPAVNRRDKKNIHIFVNGRKINEFAFVQAIEYGCEGFFPNGTHPVACLFLNVNSKLVDFNIHPAKREARFKDIAPIHRSITTACKIFFKSNGLNAIVKESAINFYDTEGYIRDNIQKTNLATNSFTDTKQETLAKVFFNTDTTKSTELFNHEELEDNSYGSRLAKLISKKPSNSPLGFEYQRQMQNSSFDDEYLEDERPSYNKIPHILHDYNKKNYDFVYLGMTLGTFLLVEYKEKLYIIDQHAAHERILFEKLLKNASSTQNLLVPYILETQSQEDDDYLESIKDNLKEAGFSIENCGDGSWQITSIPILWQGSEKDLQKDILENKKEPENLVRHILARAACRAAIKDGHVVDRDTACKIIEEALKLEDAHCPHGRPIWTVLDKAELFGRVKRS